MENKNLTENPSSTAQGEIIRYLDFSLGTEEYAIPLLSVKEVIAFPEFTPIPYTPTHFLGIMNLRGQVISVIDLRIKFGIKAQNTVETVVIICDLNPICLGIVVNSVNSVLTIAQSEINPKPDIQSSKASDYITGVTRKDKNLILLLDIARALEVADYTAIKQPQQNK